MLRLQGLSKRFGETVAVSDLSLEVGEGEFLSLLGPSGCGKTTTLRMIAGFEAPSAGRVWMAGRDVTPLPPQGRGMGMVFQNYALFPHLDVFENVAFGLKAQGSARGEVAGRVQRALELVDLAGYERRRVQALSGGQQQRVALARAIAPEPPILLLDEPLSNLDAALRERTRAELRALLKRLGMTAVFVTHDQAEAFDLSDRIALLQHGRLQQLGTPEDLYLAPANEFVANFVGKANFLPGRLLDGGGGEALCELAGGVRWRVRAPAGAGVGAAVRVMLRPEVLRLTPASTAPAGHLPGRIVERRFGGPATMYLVEAAGATLLVAEAGVPRGLPTEVAVGLDEGVVPPAFPEGAA
jgi:ABC-type Fe3+/spermidine/putrescine transport system ATPase subunit